MASNFFKSATTMPSGSNNAKKSEDTNVFMNIGKFDLDFSKSEKNMSSTPGTPKGLTEAYFSEKSILVPSSRSDIDEVIVSLNNLFKTVNSILESINNLKSSIFLIENNNNISDSDMKEFIEKNIDKSLENFFAKNFSENFEVRNPLVEGLKDDDVILIVKNPPSKQMMKVSNDVAINIIKECTCYITDNQNRLSRQLEEIKKLEMLGKKEDEFSRKQRTFIDNFSEPESESGDNEEVATQMFGISGKDN